MANAPPILLADGVRCGPEALTDTADVRTLLLQVGFGKSEVYITSSTASAP